MKNNKVDTVICIQARMSSSRFPGKVIADINGLPLIVYLYSRLKENFHDIPIVVLTSDEASDDTLVDLLSSYKINYFRGNLNNVFLRFYQFEQTLNQEINFIGRICADSPFLNTEIVKEIILKKDKNFDIITTRYYENGILKSTASKGNNFDLLNRNSIADIFSQMNTLSDEDKEHTIFPFMRRKVSTIDVSNMVDTRSDMAIDTVCDLERLNGITL